MGLVDQHRFTILCYSSFPRDISLSDMLLQHAPFPDNLRASAGPLVYFKRVHAYFCRRGVVILCVFPGGEGPWINSWDLRNTQQGPLTSLCVDDDNGMTCLAVEGSQGKLYAGGMDRGIVCMDLNMGTPQLHLFACWEHTHLLCWSGVCDPPYMCMYEGTVLYKARCSMQ